MKIYDKTTQTYKELVLKPGGDTLPIGSIIPFAGNIIPNGWLLCDGSIVEQSDYPELFSVIGTTYGYYSRTDFKLPDLRDKVPVGKDSTDTDFDELGKTGGEKTHTLTVSEMPAHDHDTSNSVGGGSGNTAGFMWSTTLADWGKQKTTSTGGGQPHNNLQPYLVTNYIIKAKNTVVVKGDVIQETGTASETNVYSAVAVDKKISDLKVIDISNKFTVKFTKTSFKALYYPRSKTIEIWFEINNVSGQNWINIMNINDTSFNVLANNYQTCYASGGAVVPVRITKTNMNINVLSDGSKDMFSGFLKIILE